jgi:hypothetical protein
MPTNFALQKCFLNFMHNESCLVGPYSMQNMNAGHQTEFWLLHRVTLKKSAAPWNYL